MSCAFIYLYPIGKRKCDSDAELILVYLIGYKKSDFVPLYDPLRKVYLPEEWSFVHAFGSLARPQRPCKPIWGMRFGLDAVGSGAVVVPLRSAGGYGVTRCPELNGLAILGGRVFLSFCG